MLDFAPMVRVNQSLLLLFMACAVAAGLTLWRMGLIQTPTQEVPEAWVPEPAVTAGTDISAAPEPAARHPVETPWTARVGAADIGQALVDLLGSVAVTSLLQVDEFPRRVVATVDNLASPHAPPMLWPVHPTPDRFTVDMREGGPVIGADNSLRYAPLVLLVEAVDTSRAVDLYMRLYPLLQRAYEELGYPNRYFNDRLIAVIDLLLATPDAEYPVKLQLTEVKGPITPLRPWVRYEFADPALESLSAGQKILLRVGPVNERRLKGKLADIRQELVKRAPKR
jgi:hypothetical protein